MPFYVTLFALVNLLIKQQSHVQSCYTFNRYGTFDDFFRVSTNLKTYTSRIFISPALSQQDRLLAKALLRRRYELISNETNSRDVKVKGLKLFVNDKEIDYCNTWLKKYTRTSKQKRLPSILLSNVRSIIKTIDELIMLCKLHFPDIIIITESWINPQYPSNVLQDCNLVSELL